MSRPPLLRAASALTAVVLLSAGLATQAAAAPGTTITVLATDLSSTNASAASTKWDAPSGAAAAALPVAGTRWALDIENKPPGNSSITADGLTLDVVGSPLALANWTKVRYQYYIGTGGYPAIDAQPHTLADMFSQPISWDTTYISGYTQYGPVLQIQLQRKLNDDTYARVTVVSTWTVGSTSTDLLNGRWFANTNMYSDGYPAGLSDGYGVRAGISVLNLGGSGPGVYTADLLQNFGDFEVVSFGPNLGRDNTYSYAVQNLTAFGQTFVFSEHAPASPSPSTSSPGTGGSTPATRTSTVTRTVPVPTPTETPAEEELPTLAVPETTTAPAPQEDEETPDTPDTEAAEDQDAGGFPLWIVLLGAGVLVFLAVLLWWLLRRRAA